MVLINVAQREISCKIVYYGPGLCGKTTNIQVVHDRTPQENKGKLTSLATEGDRTLFFDFLPLDLGTVGGMRTKFQLYTVPGQVFYNATRKLVLRGADGVIFVADSSRRKMRENVESVENLISNMKEYGMDIEDIPLVFQWNKRDLPDAVPVEELQKALNRWNAPAFEAVAVKGEGVFAALKCVSGLVLEKISRKAPQRAATQAAQAPAAARPAPAAPPAVAGPAPVAAPLRPTAPVAPPPVTGPATAVPPRPTGPAYPARPPVMQPPPVTPLQRPAAYPPAAAAAAPKAPRVVQPARPAARPTGAGAWPARPAAKPFVAAPAPARPVAPQRPAAVPMATPAVTTKLDRGLSWGIFAILVAFLIGAILFIWFKW